jgi:sn-glycerol 3-phosphate transport system permease protein
MTSIPKQETVRKPYRAARERTLTQVLRAAVPKRWYAHLVLIISCVIIGFPLFYAMLVSTQSNAQVITFQFTPGERLMEHLETVMVARHLGGYMLNTVTLAITVTVAKTILSLLAGCAFVFFRFPGKWVVFAFVLATLMMPTEILIIALFRFVSIDLQWGNTFQALAVPFLASATGTFLFRQHFANIPAELSEAAQMDGANSMQFLFRVLVPISWNTIGALAVIQFVYVWNMYLWPLLIIQGQANQVVQVGLASLRATDTTITYGPLMLGAVIASIPPLIVFLLLQKQFMSGFQLSRDK